MVLRRWSAAFCLALSAAAAWGQSLRIATWNISDFTGTNRLGDIQTALFSTGPAGRFSPDVILAQEIQSPSAATALVNALNQVEPARWTVAYGSLTGTAYTSDTAAFYRVDKLSLVQIVKVAASGGGSGQPRDTWRFDFAIVGSAHPDERIAMYDVHMKSGSTDTDIARRQIEAQHIRDDSNNLPAGYLFLVAGDMNMQSSAQQPYQTLVGVGSSARGRFFDPISTPGNWNNNASFKFVHTQDPIGASGMDDRHDQILLCGELVDSVATDYAGAFGASFSVATWNDPSQSYRTWGNDGTSYNSTLTISGNSMVGPTIAQALVNVATPDPQSPGGHLPVFLDVRYPVFARAQSISYPRGIVVSGGLQEIQESDDSKLVMRPGLTLTGAEPPVQVVITGVSPVSTATELRLRVEASVSSVGLTQTLQLWDYQGQAWTTINAGTATHSDSVVEAIAPNPSRFVEAGTRAIKARLLWSSAGPTSVYPWTVFVDQAIWLIR